MATSPTHEELLRSHDEMRAALRLAGYGNQEAQLRAIGYARAAVAATRCSGRAGSSTPIKGGVEHGLCSVGKGIEQP
jgi:hypothetical protein